MTSRWTIGPRAQKRLAEMERAGLSWQQLTRDTEGMFHVVINMEYGYEDDTVESAGTSWDKAVAEVYRQWKELQES